MKRFITVTLALYLCLPGIQAHASERILALSPAACEMLFTIGAGNDVVGAADYCNFPEAVRQLPYVANARQIFVEPALRANPTLIVAADRHIEGLKTLEERGFRIVVTHPRHFSDIFADIRHLGILTGHKKQAEHVATALEKRLKTAQSKHSHHIPVFFEVWSDPLMTQGKESFITEVIEAAGGRNVFAAIPLETIRVNIEAVLRAKPDVIVVPSTSGDIRKRRVFWHQWLKNVRVVAMNPDIISRPGPRLVHGVEILHQKLLEASQ